VGHVCRTSAHAVVCGKGPNAPTFRGIVDSSAHLGGIWAEIALSTLYLMYKMWPSKRQSIDSHTDETEKHRPRWPVVVFCGPPRLQEALLNLASDAAAMTLPLVENEAIVASRISGQTSAHAPPRQTVP